MSSVLFDAQPFDFALQRRRRLLIAVAALSMSMFFAAEDFAMANTHAVAHSKPAPSMSGGWIYG